MRALFDEEEDEETDVESDADAVEKVFELFQPKLCRERKLLKLMCHEGQHLYQKLFYTCQRFHI